MLFLKRFSWILIAVATSIAIAFGSSYRSIADAAYLASPSAAQLSVPAAVQSTSIAQTPSDEFTLPPLPYAYDALEPFIDEQTMMLHHDKHHAGYVRNLNSAIADYPDLEGASLTFLLQNLESLPDAIQTAVQNNGGGHANHTMFWESMTPDGTGAPDGIIAQAIDAQFGDFAAFQVAFNTAGKQQFGSGWAWLVLNSAGELEVVSTANQDSPISTGAQPLLGNDVWEHAYYLNYQNRRGEYLEAWWNVVNWDAVNARYEQAIAAMDS